MHGGDTHCAWLPKKPRLPRLKSTQLARDISLVCLGEEKGNGAFFIIDLRKLRIQKLQLPNESVDYFYAFNWATALEMKNKRIFMYIFLLSIYKDSIRLWKILSVGLL